MGRFWSSQRSPVRRGAEPGRIASPRPWSRLRFHRLAALVMALVLLASLCAFAFTRSVRDDNERRLLTAQAALVGQLVDSLAGQFQGPVAAAAAVAERTGGDPHSFRDMVTTTTAAGEPIDGWALLDRVGAHLHVVTTVGTDPAELAMFAYPSAEVDARLAAAFTGKFEVVGLLGTGVQRRVVLAEGLPGPGHRFVAYYEIPLARAAGTTDGAQVLGEIKLALFVGPTLRPENLVFASGPMGGTRITRTVVVGGQPISFAVWANHPLSGRVAQALPLMVFFFLALGGALVTVVIELNLRKRDAALRLVEDLDAALEQRDHADEQRSALEEQLRQSQRLEAVGQLAGGVAHDFNNLLAAIMAYADLVADDLGDHPATDDVEQIRKAARRGARLTSQLLQFGNGARESTQADAVDLNVGIAELAGLLRRAVGEDIEVGTDLGPDLPPVVIGAANLEQILMNLLVNARDAIDGAGRIMIRTDIVGATSAAAIGRPNEQFVRLSVSDTGAGMDPDVVGRIFEPFFTTKDRTRGTGLGLATVYGIVTRAGGHIRVTSAPGEGSEFEVFLATVDADTRSAAMPADTPKPDGGRGQTILIVEDEAAVRAPARRILERHGYQVAEASNGVSAVDGFQAADIDLLLTDVIMPGGLNGKDVADRFRAQDPHLPVIFMSGYSADLIARRGVDEFGSAEVLQKPFAEADLLRVVARALDVRMVVRA